MGSAALDHAEPATATRIPPHLQPALAPLEHRTAFLQEGMTPYAKKQGVRKMAGNERSAAATCGSCRPGTSRRRGDWEG